MKSWTQAPIEGCQTKTGLTFTQSEQMFIVCEHSPASDFALPGIHPEGNAGKQAPNLDRFNPFEPDRRIAPNHPVDRIANAAFAVDLWGDE